MVVIAARLTHWARPWRLTRRSRRRPAGRPWARSSRRRSADRRGRPPDDRGLAATDVMNGRPCYEVEFSDGTVIVADAEHQWRTTTRASRRQQAENRTAWYWPEPSRQEAAGDVMSAALGEPDRSVTGAGVLAAAGPEFRTVMHKAGRRRWAWLRSGARGPVPTTARRARPPTRVAACPADRLGQAGRPAEERRHHRRAPGCDHHGGARREPPHWARPAAQPRGGGGAGRGPPRTRPSLPAVRAGCLAGRRHQPGRPVPRLAGRPRATTRWARPAGPTTGRPRAILRNIGVLGTSTSHPGVPAGLGDSAPRPAGRAARHRRLCTARRHRAVRVVTSLRLAVGASSSSPAWDTGPR